MGQGAARDVIDADIGQGGNIFFGHVAGTFRFSPAVDEGYRFSHHIVAHIIQHDDVGAGFDGFADHVQRFRFDFDFTDKRRISFGQGNGLGYAAGSADVIVLEEDAVGQIITVILAAANRDGIFFKDPHVRRRLARIDQGDSRTGQQGYDLMGIGRDAAHALQIVEAYPFGRQDGPNAADDFGQLLSLVDFVAVFDKKIKPDFVIQQGKGPGKDVEAGDDAILFT